MHSSSPPKTAARSPSPGTLSDDVRAALVGIVGAVAAFFVFGGGAGSAPSDPLAAVPKSSFLVATVDLAELRRSPIHQAIAGKEASALGLGPLAESCGFDPLSRVERFAAAVPEDGDTGEFGVAARVDVSGDELERCTRALTEGRGGKTETRQVGGFVVLDSAPGKSRLAYGRGGLLVVGRGGWLDAMLAAAEHKRPGIADAPEHAALRAAMTGREGWHRPTVVATAVLPRALRERLKREMAGEDASGTTMAGVLGVSAVGVAIKAGAQGGVVEATIDLVCDAPDACAVVEKLIQKKRLDWSKDLTLRLLGIGPLVDALDVKRDGGRLRATTTASADALGAALERMIRLRRHEPSHDATVTRAPPPEPAHETLRLDAGVRDAGR